MPTPRPIKRQLARCKGVACLNLGNHSSGADTRRASASVTTNSSSVNETSTASAEGLKAKVLIPSYNKGFPVLLNQRVKLSKLWAAESPGLSQGNR